MKVNYEMLSADALRMAIKLVNALGGKTNDQICKDIVSMGGPEIPVGSISKRKSFPTGFGGKLQELAEQLTQSEQLVIARKLLQTSDTDFTDKYQSIGAGLGFSLDHWLELKDVEVDRLTTDCANANGRYLLFRSIDGISLTVTRMNIVWKTQSKMLTPGFVTIRANGGKVEKVTRGQAFMLGESVYMIGRIKRDTAVRFTRLRKVPRNQRTDLYGIRLGTSVETERPYAHFIYAYQIKTLRGATLRELLDLKELDHPLLDRQIDNMSQIRRLITAGPPEENGLVSRALESASG